jgi:sugar phosphate isomerase/epimerase
MVDLEFPSWTEIPDLETATTILEESGTANGGILVDTLHFASSRSSLELLEKLDPEIFHFIHLCDAPAEIPDSSEERIRIARDERYFPGEGGLDLAPILKRLPNVPYSLEIPNSHLLDDLGVLEYAGEALETSRSYLHNLMKQDIDIKE